MPQLLSRRDDAGWLTPSMAETLTQQTVYMPGEEALRAQVTELQQRLADRESPVRINDVRPSPSHTLYIARPETTGRLGNRRPASPNDIRRGLGEIAEQNKDWQLGFMARLQGDNESVGILLRTPQNQPLPLRQILISSAYTSRPSTLSIVMGVALEQQAVVRDLATLEHLLVVGAENTRQHFIKPTLLTLLMMNTPAELRLALIGSSVTTYDDLVQTPHTLGKMIDQPDKGARLLDGMVKEIERRRGWFLEQNVETLEGYNTFLQSRGDLPLPRILIFFDALSDAPWQADSDRWLPLVYDLLINGAAVGIHMLMTADAPEAVPDLAEKGCKTQVVMRSANPSLIERNKHLHSSALRFIDAFVVTRERANQPPDVQPVELCTIDEQDMRQLLGYWRQMGIMRAQDVSSPDRTGLTGILRELDDRPQTPAAPARPVTSSLARAAYSLAGSGDERHVQQAQALAAYLGWLGVGPLRDILGLSAAESRAVLEKLQSVGVIEAGDGPILRFTRLADNPMAD